MNNCPHKLYYISNNRLAFNNITFSKIVVTSSDKIEIQNAVADQNLPSSIIDNVVHTLDEKGKAIATNIIVTKDQDYNYCLKQVTETDNYQIYK